MSEQNFEREVLQRLTRIETNQANTTAECVPCRRKVDDLEIAVAEVKASAKSAHHRLDTMQTGRSELKKDLTDAIKEQIAGIYRTAMILGAVISFFVGLITMLIGHYIK